MLFKINLILAASAMLGIALAQGVTESIAPKGSYPPGCNKNFDGQMEVTVITRDNAAAKRATIQRRGQCHGDGVLVMTLQDGVLHDALGRTGYIAANYQFQFDAPPQQGALSTAGYCIFDNYTLALGPTTTFYRCDSGSFYNLYDREYASYCEPVQILAMPCGGSTPVGSEVLDGTVVGTEVVQTTLVRPLDDGQPQAIVTSTEIPIHQISDGQPQERPTPPSEAPRITELTDGQPQVPQTPLPAGPPVTVLPDGQPQVPQTPLPAGPPVNEHTDGQPQVPFSAPGPANTASAEATPAGPTSMATSPAAMPASNNTLGSPQPKPTQFGTSDGNRIVGSLVAMLVCALGFVALL